MNEIDNYRNILTNRMHDDFKTTSSLMKTRKLRVGRFVNLLLAISTRPDISNAVRSVARYCSAPRATHWKSGLGIPAYINGTCGFGITYQRGTTVDISLEVFADADYRAVGTLAAKTNDGAPWHKGVLQGAEKFMTFWHEEEEEASRRRATKRHFRDLESPTHL